jgi:uncharacterized membrane protein
VALNSMDGVSIITGGWAYQVLWMVVAIVGLVVTVVIVLAIVRWFFSKTSRHSGRQESVPRCDPERRGNS